MHSFISEVLYTIHTIFFVVFLLSSVTIFFFIQQKKKSTGDLQREESLIFKLMLKYKLGSTHIYRQNTWHVITACVALFSFMFHFKIYWIWRLRYVVNILWRRQRHLLYLKVHLPVCVSLGNPLFTMSHLTIWGPTGKLSDFLYNRLICSLPFPAE